MIAGGQAKGQDFTDLKEWITRYVRHTVLLGEDSADIEQILGPNDSFVVVDSMQSAVAEAAHMATCGDIVLLSPACASFDMFSGFEHRGQCFQDAVSDFLSKRQGGRQ